ncbi:hypothetical protein TL16_g12404, partial [Triparma laevis f. inornata]
LPNRKRVTPHSPPSLPPHFERRNFLHLLTLSTTLPLLPTSSSALTPSSSPPTPLKINLLSLPPSLRSSISAYTLPGATVTCISLPDVRSQSVALSVPVGSTSQPRELKGLPHFCEHMLFLGSKKYPSSLESYLSQTTGSSNAYTSPESTTYYLTSPPSPSSLDRLLRFLIDPLFDLGAVSKEINAVSSEHTKNLQSDIFRISELQKLRLNPLHPSSQFFTGNITTLLYKGEEYLRNELELWYYKTYAGEGREKASIVYISSKGLREMEGEVLERLNDLPPILNDVDDALGPDGRPDPFLNPTIPKSKIIKINPVTDLTQLTISFPITYSSEKMKQDYILLKPLDYLSFILGHEGSNSLAKKLKNDKLCTSLEVGTDDDINDYCSLNINVELTELGLKNYKKIIEVIFSYINLLKTSTLPDYIINENVIMSDLSWYYFTITNPESYVSTLSNSMLKYKFREEVGVVGDMRVGVEFLEGGQGVREGLGGRGNDRVRELVNEALTYISADNVHIDLITKEVENEKPTKWKYEELYGTKYVTEDITPSMIKTWRDVDPEIASYPSPNKFIPRKMELQNVNEGLNPSKVPLAPLTVLSPIETSTLWYKPDLKFLKPKTLTTLLLRTKNHYRTSKNVAMSNIYENVIQRKFNEFLYDAQLAGKSFTVTIGGKGTSITVGGWDGDLISFWESCLLKLSSFVIRKEEFESSREEIFKNSKMFDYAMPYSLAGYYGGLVFDKREDRKEVYDVREEIKNASYDDFKKFSENMFDGEAVMLTQGNFDYNLGPKPGLRYLSIFDQIFPARKTDSKYVQPIINIIKDPVKIKVKNPNPQNFNAATTLVVQSSKFDMRSNLIIEISCAILSERFYEELRTIKQLGYVVNLSVKGLGDGRGAIFTVMSGSYGSKILEKEIEIFLEKSVEVLESIGGREFKTVVKGLGERKSENDKRLGQEFVRNWAEIVGEKYVFDRREKEVQTLAMIKKEEVVNLWRDIVESKQGRVWASVVPSAGPIRESVDDVIEGEVVGQGEIASLRAELDKTS